MDSITFKERTAEEQKKAEEFVGRDDFSEPSSGWQKFKEYVWEVFKVVVISLLIIIPIRVYGIQPFIVEGDSMEPNFHNGEYLVVNEIGYILGQPERGDVVIFHPPQDKSVYYIKRIIGLPGETVKLNNNGIYITEPGQKSANKLIESDYLVDGQINEIGQVTLGEDEYYVLGDNRSNSKDSRFIGPVNLSLIKGKAMIRAYPFNEFTFFKQPLYNFSN